MSEMIYAFSRRLDGNMSFKFGDTKGALANRRKFLEPLGIDFRRLVCADQVHGNRVEYVIEPDAGKGALCFETSIANTDALITEQKNLPLAVFTADCLSVFLFDPHTPAIGMVHAGWRGTRVKITAKAVKRMKEKFKTQPEGLKVILGPSMRACCFEVKDKPDDFSFSELIKREGRFYFDIIAENKRQLLSAGVRAENISDSGKCTYCGNEDYFSFRKEADKSGRIMSLIMLKGQG